MSTLPSSKPWLASYAPGVRPEVEVPKEDIGLALERSIAAFGDRTALDFMGSSLTYAELGDRVTRAAGMLSAQGVKHGDRVAIAMPNAITHVVAFYAVLRLGAIVVEHNPLYTQSELVHQLNDSGATLAVFWDKTAATLGSAIKDTSVTTLISVDVSRDLPLTKKLLLRLPVAKARETKAALCDTPPPYALAWHVLTAQAQDLSPSHPRPAATDLAVLQYTGGTTGTPKGAMLTHQNLGVNAAQGAEWTGAKQAMGTEVVYGVLPFFHAFGLTLCLTYALQIAATVVLLPKFDVASFLAAQKKRPGTFLPAVPPILARLAEAGPKAGADLTSFKYAISGAMPLPAKTASDWERVTKGLVIEGYGMTETSPVALGNPLSADRIPGRLGLPFPSTDAMVVDQNDGRTRLAQGERGELLVSGPQVFQGYWGKPEESAYVLVDIDGVTWIRTGDVAVMDERGSFTLVDRIKEMIITGGFKVFPSQVEATLRKMPGIADCAVVGLPASGDLGERVVAALVLSEGAQAPTLEQVQAWCDADLARYALPREIVVLDSLPVSQIGKVMRRVVRDQILAGA